MKVLAVGGAGYVGGAVTDLLMTGPHEVRVYDALLYEESYRKVSNHRAGFVRAWHAHRHEAKYVMVVQGAAIVAAVKIDDWNTPDKDAPVQRIVLAAHKPSVWFIPAGYANGLMSLTTDTKLMFFSTSSLEESKGDDVRYDAWYWDVWRVVER